MKNYILLFLFLTSVPFFSSAQNELTKTDDLGRISIAPVLGELVDVPASSKKLLLSKMKQIASKSGLASFNNRFIMFCSLDVISNNITATTPIMHSYELNVTLYIADNMTKSIYSSTNTTLRGVGKTKDKAYMMALKRLDYRTHNLEFFINEGKKRIVSYYNSDCDFILKESQSLADSKNYDKAMFNVSSIPKICKDCYMKGQDLLVTIFNQKMENDCVQNMNNAQVAKAQNNHDLAASYLSNILPDVSCYNNAQKLLQEIENHRCEKELGSAQGAWAAKNLEQASSALSNISADSECYNDALILISKIKKELKDEAQRELDMQIKAKEEERLAKEEERLANIEVQRINAIKDICINFSEYQESPDLNWVKSLY